MQPNPYAQPQQYPQAPAQQPAPGADPFANPVMGGNGLKIRDLANRYVILVPRYYDANAKSKDGNTTRPSVTMDVIVLDGGPLIYGDTQDNAGRVLSPPTMRADVMPMEFLGVIASNDNIVRAVRDQLATQSPVIGRIVRSDVGNRPWNLAKLDPFSPADSDIRTRAGQLWSAKLAGQWVSPKPVPIGGAPAPAQQPYAQPNAAYGAPAPAQGYAGGHAAPALYAPQQPVQPAYAAAAQPYGQPQPAQPQPAPFVPAGWDPAVWATLTPEQQGAIQSQAAPASIVAPVPGGPGQPPTL